jgi:hypothetical protein
VESHTFSNIQTLVKPSLSDSYKAKILYGRSSMASGF